MVFGNQPSQPTQKSTGGVVQVVKRLPDKRKTSSSNSSANKKKKRKRMFYSDFRKSSIFTASGN
jgi:hypothetical protein